MTISFVRHACMQQLRFCIPPFALHCINLSCVSSSLYSMVLGATLPFFCSIRAQKATVGGSLVDADKVGETIC